MTTDAIVVGSGPNGLAAAITLASAGLAVKVYEAAERPGGGARCAELTLPAFVHDVCSAVHPLAAVSPFFRSLPLEQHGLRWRSPPALVAHPLDGGRAVLLEKDLERLPQQIGKNDARRYAVLFKPWLRHADTLMQDLLQPLRLPRHPWLLAGFGARALLSAKAFSRIEFQSAEARALFAGIAGHAAIPLEDSLSAGVALTLCLAGHAAGWPVPEGGSQKITDALTACFGSLGGELVCGVRINSIEELPPAHLYLFDVSPRQLAGICEKRLPASYREKLLRFAPGSGVFKMDFALSAPAPWAAAECLQTATVHLGGTFEEVASAEREVALGRHPEKPFVLVTQPSLFDPSRAPAGCHTLWAYCHVPNGSTFDMSERVRNQLERFAPGFSERILKEHKTFPADLESYNANCSGGDISGGMLNLRQFFTRPAGLFNPYKTPAAGIYICSASTPPGPGVHGMCGYHAARMALLEFARIRRD